MSLSLCLRERILSPALVVVPFVIYTAPLFFEIPYQLTQFFYTYSFLLLAVLLIAFYFSFRLQGKLGLLVGLSLTALLFALTLSYKWTSAFSNNRVIAAILPYKDGRFYYFGAEVLLNGSTIPADGVQAAGRPLFPGFLAGILFFVNGNLHIAMAVMVALTGLFCYLAACEIQDVLGEVAASFFMTFLYLYIQPLVGTTLSELPGLMFGCIGFIILWRAARNFSWIDAILGLITLMVGVSMRAGAFFIFPLLIVWAGWVYRERQRFSKRAAAIFTTVSAFAFLLVNAVYPRISVAPGGATFGNFAYALYGQVLGGAGWHRAIEDLQTRDPSIVYREAFNFFTLHPFSLVIAIAKSYRDFFLPGYNGILSFITLYGITWLDVLLWLATLGLLGYSIFLTIREIRQPLPAFILAGFIGIVLSIPFLPPIDGGRRFYASTMPFFYAMVIYSIGTIHKKRDEQQRNLLKISQSFIRISSSILLFLTVVFPLLLIWMVGPLEVSAPVCSSGQVPFVVKIDPASYVDLVPAGAGNCGLSPALCLADFKENGVEKKVDDFFQALVVLADSSSKPTRIVPTYNLIDGVFHYFVGVSDRLEPSSQTRLVSGCAVEIRTINQSIYKVESTSD